jgi:4-amino-4-deoxy-L-arabinose transferase-like glycosyltransferase
LWQAEKSAAVTRVLCLCAVCYVCLFAGLDSFGLVGPDEPRYASVAREMARRGDWVTPRLNGSPWFEKPPLYYWTAAIGFRVFSSPEVAARIPSSVFALVTLLAVLWVARKIYGAPVAHLAGWMLPTAVGMLGFAHAAATDMPFAACLTLAMVAAAVLLFDDSPEQRGVWAAGFGAMLGLAVLAKGPAGVVLAGGSTALWATATGNVRRSFRLLNPVAIGAFLLVALPWYVFCAVRNPEFLRVFLLEHNVERFLTNRYQHQQPFWFFLPILLLALFPWTLLLIPAVGDAWRALPTGAWRQTPTAFFAAWVVFPFVFFSASQSKLPGYILPAVPPLLLLLAHSAIARLRRDPRWKLHFFIHISLPFIVAGVAISVLCNLSPGRLPTDLRLPVVDNFSPLSQLSDAAIGLAIFGLALLVHYFEKLRSRWTYLLLTASIVGWFVWVYPFLGAVDFAISARWIGREAQGYVRPPDKVATYHLKRAWQYGVEFYLRRPLPEWTSGTPCPEWIITDNAGRGQLSGMGWSLEAKEPGSLHATLFRVKNVPP